MVGVEPTSTAISNLSHSQACLIKPIRRYATKSLFLCSLGSPPLHVVIGLKPICVQVFL